MLSRAKLSGFQVLKGRQREKRDRGVRYPKKGIDTSPLSYQARPGATTYLCISMGLSLTDEKVSMKLPGDNTRTSTPMPSTKIPSTGYKYQVSFHSFIYLFLHSFTHPISIYYIPNTALNIRKAEISKNSLCSKGAHSLAIDKEV